jgi:pilus assembly protein Flp/PilA
MAAAKGIPRVQAMDTQQLAAKPNPVITAVVRWWRDERGVTAIEYGLLAALIAAAAIGGFSALGDSLTGLYDRWSAAVVAALNG